MGELTSNLYPGRKKTWRVTSKKPRFERTVIRNHKQPRKTKSKLRLMQDNRSGNFVLHLFFKGDSNR